MIATVGLEVLLARLHPRPLGTPGVAEAALVEEGAVDGRSPALGVSSGPPLTRNGPVASAAEVGRKARSLLRRERTGIRPTRPPARRPTRIHVTPRVLGRRLLKTLDRSQAGARKCISGRAFLLALGPPRFQDAVRPPARQETRGSREPGVNKRVNRSHPFPSTLPPIFFDSVTSSLGLGHPPSSGGLYLPPLWPVDSRKSTHIATAPAAA